MFILKTVFFLFYIDFSYFFYSLNKNASFYFGYWHSEYFFIAFYFCSCLFVTLILFCFSVLLITKSTSFEQSSPYECGFEPFKSNTYLMFNIQYFLVGILFLLFDLEVIFLIIWVLYLGNLSILAFWSVLFFLVLLVFGFIYEWKNGSLDWV